MRDPMTLKHGSDAPRPRHVLLVRDASAIEPALDLHYQRVCEVQHCRCEPLQPLAIVLVPCARVVLLHEHL